MRKDSVRPCFEIAVALAAPHEIASYSSSGTEAGAREGTSWASVIVAGVAAVGRVKGKAYGGMAACRQREMTYHHQKPTAAGNHSTEILRS